MGWSHALKIWKSVNIIALRWPVNCYYWALTYLVSQGRASLDRRSTTPHVFIRFKMQNGAFQAKFYEFGSRGIWGTIYPIYVIKPLILWQKHHFYNINRVYCISNTPGTKFMKFGLKYSNSHFKKYKIIKFEPTWDWLEPSLESLQRIHVKSKYYSVTIRFLQFIFYKSHFWNST